MIKQDIKNIFCYLILLVYNKFPEKKVVRGKGVKMFKKFPLYRGSHQYAEQSIYQLYAINPILLQAPNTTLLQRIQYIFKIQLCCRGYNIFSRLNFAAENTIYFQDTTLLQRIQYIFKIKICCREYNIFSRYNFAAESTIYFQDTILLQRTQYISRYNFTAVNIIHFQGTTLL